MSNKKWTNKVLTQEEYDLFLHIINDDLSQEEFTKKASDLLQKLKSNQKKVESDKDE